MKSRHGQKGNKATPTTRVVAVAVAVAVAVVAVVSHLLHTTIIGTGSARYRWC